MPKALTVEAVASRWDVSAKAERVRAQQAAEFLGISLRMLQDLTKRGKIPAAKIGGIWTYDRNKIAGWARQNRLAIDAYAERTTRPKRAGVVYFIAANGMVKIGFTQNIDERMKAIQATSPTQIELIGTLPGSLRLEREIHERFKHARAHGEWFQATPEILRAAKGR